MGRLSGKVDETFRAGDAAYASERGVEGIVASALRNTCIDDRGLAVDGLLWGYCLLVLDCGVGVCGLGVVWVERGEKAEGGRFFAEGRGVFP